MAISTRIQPFQVDTRGQANAIEQDLANISTGVAQGFQTAINIRKQQVEAFNKTLENLEKLKLEGDIAHRAAISDKINDLYNKVSSGVFQARKKGGRNKFVGLGAQKIQTEFGELPLDEYIRTETQRISSANTRSQAMKEAYDNSVRMIEADKTIPASRKIIAVEELDSKFKDSGYLFNDVSSTDPDDPNTAFNKIIDNYRNPELARGLASKEYLDLAKSELGASEETIRRADNTPITFTYIPDVHEIVKDENGNVIKVDVNESKLDDFVADQLANNPVAVRDLIGDVDVDVEVILEVLKGRRAISALEDYEEKALDKIKAAYRSYFIPKRVADAVKGFEISRAERGMEIQEEELRLRREAAKQKAKEGNGGKDPSEEVVSWLVDTEQVAKDLMSTEPAKVADAVDTWNRRSENSRIVTQSNVDRVYQELVSRKNQLETALEESKSGTEISDMSLDSGGSLSITAGSSIKEQRELQSLNGLIEAMNEFKKDEGFSIDGGIFFLNERQGLTKIDNMSKLRELWDESTLANKKWADEINNDMLKGFWSTEEPKTSNSLVDKLNQGLGN